MSYLTCIDPNEKEISVPFEAGDTLLQATYRADVVGILAECGGGCSCATCHIILDKEWDGTANDPTEQEKDMLEFAVNPTGYSRLACQLILNEQHDGLTVRVAKRQY